MRTLSRSTATALLVALLALSLAACGGDAATSESSGTSPAESPVEQQEAATPPAVETEVSGMPAGFPADVPVHPGTVTSYEPMQVTDDTVVHQLDVVASASFDAVVAWYQADLPAGWTVGYFEDASGSNGAEAKIALDGGSYTPASPEGLGGGVLVGIIEIDSGTRIVTTVTVMGTP